MQCALATLIKWGEAHRVRLNLPQMARYTLPLYDVITRKNALRLLYKA